MVINETLKIIKQRRSIRSYKPEQIKEEELQAILQAGMYAPNAGDQAWHFTAIQNKNLLDRLNSAAKEAALSMNIEGLRELGGNADFNCLYNAPTLILVSADTNSMIPLDADCNAAAENMLIAAESMNIGSCWIFFVLLAFNSAKGGELLSELKIPRGYKPCNAAVFGYKNTPDIVPPERKSGIVTIIN
jgi:nitroreductase